MATESKIAAAELDAMSAEASRDSCCGTAATNQAERVTAPAAASSQLAAPGRQSRRGMLALGAAAAAGAAVALSPKGASAHGTSHLESASAAEPAIHARNAAAGGNAILGDLAAGGIAIKAVNDKGGSGLQSIQQALDVNGTGYTAALGNAIQGVGCCGVIGVKPFWSLTIGAAIWGTAHDARGQSHVTGASLGVLGTQSTPLPTVSPNTGVYGISNRASGIGVHARSGHADADALRVGGRARFSSVGAGLVPEGASEAAVAIPSVTAASHVSVTLTGDSENQAAVTWVERIAGVGFTVHLNRNAGVGTPFTYFIVEPSI
jgi:hypothetical protein